MLEWLAPTAVIGLLGAASVFIGRLFTRRNDKDTLLLASRDSFIDDLREEIKDTRERLGTVETTMQAQSERLDTQAKQIHDLQTRNWGFRRYIQLLVDFIRANDLHPPDPPTDINL